MLLIIVGVLLIALKAMDINPVAGWSWYVALAPFPLAAVWWFWSDKSGRTSRVAMDKDEERKDTRRREQFANLGLKSGPKESKKEARAREARQRHVDKVEGERERRRRINRDSILTSRMDSNYDSQASTKGGDDSLPPATADVKSPPAQR